MASQVKFLWFDQALAPKFNILHVGAVRKWMRKTLYVSWGMGPKRLQITLDPVHTLVFLLAPPSCSLSRPPSPPPPLFLGMHAMPSTHFPVSDFRRGPFQRRSFSTTQ
jgi:hypothetical protein